MDIPLSQIFRVIEKGYQLTEDGIYEEKIVRIIVFKGNMSDKNVDEKILFDGLDITNVDIVYVSEYIHPDDTIEVIKHKLNVHGFNSERLLDEFYLFSFQQRTIELAHIYKNLTEKSMYVSKNDMSALLNNWTNNNSDDDVLVRFAENDKQEYSFDDWVSIFNGYQYTTHYYAPIGVEFTTSYDHRFTGNPFRISSSVKMFQPSNVNELYTYNTSLLFNYGKFTEFEYNENPNFLCNTIYFCVADNFLMKYNETGLLSDLNQHSLINLYFPGLKEKEIFNLISLQEQRAAHLKEYTKKMVPYLTNQSVVSKQLYSLHNSVSSKTTMPFLDCGLTRYHFEIQSYYTNSLPLEIIFKQLHAHSKLPFIKYNPGQRHENQYRLFSDKLSTSGSKLPSLKKSDILRYTKEVTTTKSIGFVYQFELDGRTYSMFIEWTIHGVINIHGELSPPIEYTQWDLQFPLIFNEFMKPYRSLLSSFGFSVPFVSNLYESFINCIHADYVWKIKKSHPFEMKPFSGCVYSLFDETKKLKYRNLWNYKKVSNFTAMEAKTALIINLSQQNHEPDYIVEQLMLQYSLSLEDAKQEYGSYLSSLETKYGTTKNVEHPGFPTVVDIDSIDNTITVYMNNIHDYSYLYSAHVYVSSLLYVSQHPEDSFTNTTKNVCKELQPKALKEPTLHVIKAVPVEVVHPDKKEEEIDAFYFSDDDDDEEESDDDEMAGGTKKHSKRTISIKEPPKEATEKERKKQLLKRFDNKKRTLEPNMWLKKDDGPYKTYSRICPNTDKRQPVILTEEEKIEIDKKYRDAYSYAIRYGSDPKKKYWYMCPKYWCVKTNTPMTKEQIDNGECKDSEGQEMSVDLLDKPIPGFLRKNVHPTSCVPCCFDDWKSHGLPARRKECGITNTDIEYPTDTTPDDENKENSVKKGVVISDNILGIEKIPLGEYRSGLIPDSIRLLFGFEYDSKMQKKNTTLLLPNTYAMLRYGVEQTKHQSFLGAMASVYQYVNGQENKLSIAEFRKLIASSFTKDEFEVYQQGSLVSSFRPVLEEIKDSKEAQYEYEVEQSYQNFIAYLSDEDAWIDHTYLWDFITEKKSGDHMFGDGMNLIIFHVTHHDITDNVELICSNTTLFDASKPTFFIVKQDDYYEPIYLQAREKKDNVVKQSHFRLDTVSSFDGPLRQEIEHIVAFLRELDAHSSELCQSRSVIKEYTYKTNITAKELRQKLSMLDSYVISGQIANYQGKIIALLVGSSDYGNVYYIPTKPSSSLKDLETIYIDRLDSSKHIHGYLETKTFLMELHIKDKSILCAPLLKFVEDSMVVGILTETNQLIPIQPEQLTSIEEQEGSPILETRSIVHMKSSEDYLGAEAISSSSYQETKKETLIDKLKLDDHLYRSFRTLCKSKLAEYSNFQLLMKLKQVVQDKDIYYQLKLKIVRTLIKELLQEFVDFSLDTDKTSQELLMGLAEVPCNEFSEGSAICSVQPQGAKLILPSKHVINGDDSQFPSNESFYYSKLADELIRNRRIRLYMLQPRSYTFIEDVDYKINNDELFITQSELSSDLFDTDTTIHPTQNTMYIHNTTYTNAQPIVKKKPLFSTIELF